jgi:hypothetical protein
MSSRPALGLPVTLSLGIKRLGSEADYSSSTSVEVKNMWIYTSTSPYAFMV